MRAKGDIEKFNLHDDLGGPEELRSVTVSIQHVGPGLQRKWALTWKRIFHDEQLRLIKLRKGFTKEEAPYLWPDETTTLVTPEGEEAGMKAAQEIIGDAVTAVEGWGPLQGVKDPEALMEELERLGVVQEVMSKCAEVQALTPRQFPIGAGSGDVRPRKGPTKKAG